MKTYYLFTAKIVNTATSQTLKSIHADSQEKLQERYNAWKVCGARHYRLKGFHVVLTKEVSVDREWVMVSSRVGKIEE